MLDWKPAALLAHGNDESINLFGHDNSNDFLRIADVIESVQNSRGFRAISHEADQPKAKFRTTANFLCQRQGERSRTQQRGPFRECGGAVDDCEEFPPAHQAGAHEENCGHE